MGWLLATIYDPYMCSCERAGLGAWRSALLTPTHGEVLEIGAGTGTNLEHYPRTLDTLVLAEPDAHMRRKLEARVSRSHSHQPIVRAWEAHRLDAPDRSFDFVVSTLVLCTVPDPFEALTELHRVLRPGGSLLFLEHVAAPRDASRFRWQRRLEPIWKRAAGNCHLTRDTEAEIERSGFRIEEIERGSMRKALPILRPTIRGRAVKR